MQATNPASIQTGTQAASSPLWLTLWKDASAATASTLTGLGLLAAGFYSVWLYRNRFPRVRVTHQVFDWPAGERRMVRGVVRVENVGKVIVQVRCIRGVLTQILPLTGEMAAALAARRTLLDGDNTEVIWDTLDDQTKDFSRDCCEIESGEIDEFIFDFVIDADVTKVQFYSHVDNVKKFKRNVGWNTTIIYDLTHGKEDGHVAKNGAGTAEAGQGAAFAAQEGLVELR